MKIIVIILAVAALTQQCSDFLNDIHSFISTISDVFSTTEANIRVQYNLIHMDRIKTVSSQVSMLKNIQNEVPTNLCKYSKVEDSVNMLNIGQDLVNNMRKNLIYAVRASFEEMRNDHSNIIYAHLVMMQDFLEDCAEPSKSYFTDGKTCVMALENNIKTFLETSANRIVQCMKSTTTTSPLQHPKFKSDLKLIEDVYARHVTNIKKPFTHPVIITQFSSKSANETASNNLFNASFITFLRYKML